MKRRIRDCAVDVLVGVPVALLILLILRSYA